MSRGVTPTQLIPACQMSSWDVRQPQRTQDRDVTALSHRANRPVRIRPRRSMEPRVAKQRTPRKPRSMRLNDPVSEVLAAWIIALFGLVAGLSLLSFHQRDFHDEGIAAAVPRWCAPPV